MIQAKELRIGNLVYVRSKEIRKVSSLSTGKTPICTLIKGCGVSEVHFSESAVDPAPITEEWLLRFGFEKNDRFFNLNYVLLLKVSDCFLYYYSNLSDSRATIKYVHQLQNLYFSLTGEELSLKL